MTKPIKQRRGRPAQPLPDTHDTIARVLVTTAPKALEEWRYLTESDDEDPTLGYSRLSLPEHKRSVGLALTVRIGGCAGRYCRAG